MPSFYEAQIRHAQYYQNILHQSEEHYYRNGKYYQEGLDLFDREKDNIKFAQAWTASQVEFRNDAAELCSKFASAAVTLLTRQFPADEGIQWLEVGLNAARKLQKKYDVWGHLANLGDIYTIRGDIAKAISCYQGCLQVVEELGERARRGKGVILGKLGTAYYTLNEIKRAIACYEDQLIIAREYKEPQEISAALGNLGRVHRANKQFDKAITLLEEALKITQESGDIHGEGVTLGSLAQVYFDLQNHKKTIECFEEYLFMMRQIGDRQSECTALAGLAHAYHASGDTQQAIESSEAALIIAREMNSRREEARALGTLGYFHHSLGKHDKAIEMYKAGQEIAEVIGDQQYIISARSGLGTANMALKKYKEAFENFKFLYEHYYELKDLRQQGLTLYSCSICAANLGDTQKAVEFAETSANMLAHVDDPNAEKSKELLSKLREHPQK
ncbi:MAG: hypothetical protein CV087_06800 [Candidatus Brocadia sp. WS118]|nr:MAG: hypothetical protein CV087_06800 [Candidatus Brocadia sp. WS118]